MDITYRKVNNSELFNNFKDENLLNMSECQNYIPLYNNFFSLNENNYNLIGLNNKNYLACITKKTTENIFSGIVKDESNNIIANNVFFKLSPLLDPYKYLAGKYDIQDETLFNLPKINNNCHYKISDVNNSSYVDSFFTYLTSQLLNRNDFLHGLDFYGSYLGIKNNYHVDISEDIDMLSNNNFFHENNNKLFRFLNTDHEDLFNQDSRNNKKRLEFGNNIELTDILNLEDITSIDCETPLNDEHENDKNDENDENGNYENEHENNGNKDENDENENVNENDKNDENVNDEKETSLIYEHLKRTSKSSKYTNSSNSSEVSSRSSNTENSNSEVNDEDNDEDEDNDDDSYYSDESSSDIEDIMVSINKFPIQIIALEKCSNTLDYLFVEEKLSQDELTCIIIQILMMLITYQKLFNLTHNDLHTNNIMFVETERRYLYYKLDGKHYKVKTYGKIFKIIDFGRAIYKYKNKLICSDSFHKEGDAATQYNFEPYYNDKKNIVEPNLSFDLCRLGCSIYDFITEKYETIEEIHWPIHKVIMKWCDDDDGRNILYKNNDEERYPDFKLYKMIARKVHNHLPINEIKNKCFEKYIVPKKEIKKGSKIMNIDLIDCK